MQEGACIGAATMLQPWTLRLILNAAALAAASPTLLFRPWWNAARCVLLLQDLVQSCSRGGGRIVEARAALVGKNVKLIIFGTLGKLNFPINPIPVHTN